MLINTILLDEQSVFKQAAKKCNFSFNIDIMF